MGEREGKGKWGGTQERSFHANLYSLEAHERGGKGKAEGDLRSQREGKRRRGGDDQRLFFLRRPTTGWKEKGGKRKKKKGASPIFRTGLEKGEGKGQRSTELCLTSSRRGERRKGKRRAVDRTTPSKGREEKGATGSLCSCPKKREGVGRGEKQQAAHKFFLLGCIGEKKREDLVAALFVIVS